MEKRAGKKPRRILRRSEIVRAVRSCINTDGERYLGDWTLFSILFHFRNSK